MAGMVMVFSVAAAAASLPGTPCATDADCWTPGNSFCCDYNAVGLRYNKVMERWVPVEDLDNFREPRPAENASAAATPVPSSMPFRCSKVFSCRRKWCDCDADCRGDGVCCDGRCTRPEDVPNINPVDSCWSDADCRVAPLLECCPSGLCCESRGAYALGYPEVSPDAREYIETVLPECFARKRLYHQGNLLHYYCE